VIALLSNPAQAVQTIGLNLLANVKPIAEDVVKFIQAKKDQDYYAGGKAIGDIEHLLLLGNDVGDKEEDVVEGVEGWLESFYKVEFSDGDVACVVYYGDAVAAAIKASFDDMKRNDTDAAINHTMIAYVELDIVLKKCYTGDSADTVTGTTA
jgi:hypothetical protein